MAEKIICPICGSDKTQFYCEKNKYKVSCCRHCEAGFVSPTPKGVENIYGKEYFKNESGGNFGYSDYDQDKEPMKEVFIFYIKKIENLTAGRNIFDIGAATGYFLNLAKDRDWQTAGAEISTYAADIAKKRGHEVFFGRFPEANIKNKFDVITMWDVLEHLDNPGQYLLAANKALSATGWLIVNTINRKSFWARALNKYWHLLVPPEHLFYYTPKSLGILLEKSGFEIKEKKLVGKKFSLSYIFSTLYHWQKLKIWAILSKFFDRPFWRKFSLPINLGDNILIIAKKIKNV